MSEIGRFMDRTGKLIIDHSRERVAMLEKLAVGEISKKEALAILDRQEKNSSDIIAAVNRRIDELETDLKARAEFRGWLSKAMEKFAKLMKRG